MRIKHNKLKNTGILFELLVRQIAADVLDGNNNSFAIALVKEHFHSASELGKELQLYRSFFNLPSTLSENKSMNMLDIVLQRRQKLNEKLLDAQKFLLIKEIKDHCNLKTFMSGRVPSYKVYASIYKLFESIKTDSADIEDVIASQYVVVEHLRGNIKEEQIIKESNYTNAMREQPEEIRQLSYKFLLEKFNEKYSVFNDKQKALLREYINSGANVEKFSKYVFTETSKLENELARAKSKIKDEVTRIKMNEVIHQLHLIQKKNAIKDNHVTALLIAYQISHELNSLR